MEIMVYKYTCNVKAVIVIATAKEPVSRMLKLRSILIPIIQATITHRGTYIVIKFV